jgi:ActR/RegA family two-component response regulator
MSLQIGDGAGSTAAVLPDIADAMARPRTERHARTKVIRSVLLLDDQAQFVSALASELSRADIEVWTASSFQEATAVYQVCRADVVVAELRVGNRPLVRELPEMQRTIPIENLVIATLYPSVATAVRLIRLGVRAYLTKPMSAATLMEALTLDGMTQAPEADDLRWPSLDRAIWEYLSQVHTLAGSMSEAARRLGLDPRSLRRMLTKYPPPR